MKERTVNATGILGIDHKSQLRKGFHSAIVSRPAILNGKADYNNELARVP